MSNEEKALKQKELIAAIKEGLKKSGIKYSNVEDIDDDENYDFTVFNLSKSNPEFLYSFCLPTDYDIEKLNDILESLRNAKIKTQEEFKSFILGSELKNSFLITSDYVDNFLENNPGAKIEDCEIWQNVGCIGEGAFGRSEMTEITLPPNLQFISFGAFYTCQNLAKLTLPNTVTVIRKQAFYQCKNLQQINIPDNVVDIGEDAFRECSNLSEIDIQGSVTEIKKNTFRYCRKWEKVVLPNTLTVIDKDAFGYCTNLKEINLPQNLTAIKEFAFENCGSLAINSIPESVTEIGDDAFQGCNISEINHKILKIKNGFNISDDGKTLLYCANANLGEVTIPDSIEIIDGLAFAGCNGITKIIIPDSVTTEEFGSQFVDCSNLEEIKLPATLTEISNGMFRGCGFKSFTVPQNIKTIQSNAFSKCEKLTEVEILPSSVETICSSAFQLCPNLTKITISDSVKVIERNIFFNSQNLKTVIYTGSKDDWEKINIDQTNASLLNAEIIFQK